MKITEKIWLTLLWAVVLATTVSIARAESELHFEALGGRCTYTEVGDGIWFNVKYDYKLDMRAGCSMLAISSMGRNAGSLALGWRVAYVDMGTAHAFGVYPTVEAEQALPAFDGLSCDPSTMSGCLMRGQVHQSARGFSFGYVAEWTVRGAQLGAEAGGLLYDGEVKIHLNPEPAGTWPRPGWADLRWRGTQATVYIGATVRYKYLLVSARDYGRIRAAQHGCGHCSGVAGGPLRQMLIGLSVPF